MILLSISIFWLSVCVDPISADNNITVEAHVGSTALLPCTLSKVFTQTSIIRWKDNNEVVFERSFNGTDEGPGYKGRVDVPEDELRKGNCSLVLKDVRVTDHAFYRSFMVEHVEVTNTDKIQEINIVQLSVFQSVSAQVGSTAVLPCYCRNISIQTPHVEWRTGDETVFKREGKDTSYGEGYEGRVDFSEEELLKGNCSLVLKNVSVTDETLYSGFILTNDKKNPEFVLKVKLSVSEKSEKSKDDPSAPSAYIIPIVCSLLLILLVSLLWKFWSKLSDWRHFCNLRSSRSQNNRHEEDPNMIPLNQQANNCEVQDKVSD